MAEMEQPAGATTSTHGTGRRVVEVALSAIVIAFIFGYGLPRLVDYPEVWRVITNMTWLELVTLGGLALWNIVTYWLVMVSSLPGSNIWQAMKVNQTSTAVSNTLPGGSAIGIAVTYGMYTAYGFSRSEVGLSVLVTGLWNNFVKLAMPIIALVLLALEGNASPGLITGAVLGLGGLVVAVAVGALILRSEEYARRVGARLGSITAGVRRLLHRPTTAGDAERVVAIRAEAIELLKKRWLWLTLATVASHISLFLVLLIALRHVGVSQAEITWIEALAAFSFVRLLTALPITPGGVGIVELGLSAALVAAGGAEAQTVAAVLIYRALTYVLPIPFGIAAYLKWRSGSARRKERAEEQRRTRLAGTRL